MPGDPAVILVVPDGKPKGKVTLSLDASHKFLAKLKVDQLSRAIDAEDVSVADLLIEIDKFCADLRSSTTKGLSTSVAAQQLKICDSLIRRAKKSESREDVTTFLKQKLAKAIQRLEEFKTNIRKVRRDSLKTGEKDSEGRNTPQGERSESHIDLNKFKDSNKGIFVPVPESGDPDLNETGDKEWNKLITGQPSPNIKLIKKLAKQRTCPEEKKNFDFINFNNEQESIGADKKISAFTDPVKKISFLKSDIKKSELKESLIGSFKISSRRY